jgi:hypothetical protein
MMGALPPNPRDLTPCGRHRLQTGRQFRPPAIMPAPESALEFHPWRALPSAEAAPSISMNFSLSRVLAALTRVTAECQAKRHLRSG